METYLSSKFYLCMSLPTKDTVHLKHYILLFPTFKLKTEMIRFTLKLEDFNEHKLNTESYTGYK